MKKKGFTLIELLAIIVILAIIAVITVPLILNIVEDASKNAAIDSAYGYKDAINKYYATKSLRDSNYFIPSGAYYVDGDTGYLDGAETLDIAVSGRVPSFGKVTIGTSSKVQEANLCINNYMILIRDGEDISVVKGCTPVEPGLYDQNNNLVVSYDYLVSEYGFDPSIDRNYSSQDTNNNILANYSNGVKLVLPDTVTKIGERAFYYNVKLTSITIPSSVTSIGNYAFSGCSNLTSVTFESGSQLESIGDYAFNSTGITSITIPSSTTSIGSYAFNGIKVVYYTGSATGSPWGANSLNPYVEGDFVYSDNTKTVLQAYTGTSSSVTIPSGVTSIGDYAFYRNKNLTSVTIPSSVTSIGKYAFYYDDGLTSVTIPSSVTSIGNNAFYSCSNLTSVTFEGGSQLASIGNNAFASTGLSTITIPSSTTSIGSYAFSDIKVLNYTGSATGSPWGANNVNPYVDGDFAYGDSTKKVLKAYIGSSSSVTIPASVTSIGNSAFYKNKNLTSITIPSSVTSIGDYAFFLCSNLTSVTLSSGLKSIGMFAFTACEQLTSITIPSSVTSIGNNAFASTGLTSITIPSSVTSIKPYAFTGISTVYYNGSASGSPWGANQVIRN